jgi:hypothetical protein
VTWGRPETQQVRGSRSALTKSIAYENELASKQICKIRITAGNERHIYDQEIDRLSY